MAMSDVQAPPIDDLRTLLPDFERHLKAVNRAPLTIKEYIGSAHKLVDFLVAEGMPTSASGITREHLEHFIVALSERPSARTGKPLKPAAVAKHYRQVQQFWRWLAEEGEIQVNPFAKMHPPAVPEQPVPVLPEHWITKLLDVCKGTTFEARRDAALLRVFIDCGVRLDEMRSMEHTPEHLDFGQDVVWVFGKGRRERFVPFGPKTGEALRRYLRRRSGHPHARSAALWLGKQGPLTTSGISAILDRRIADAGLPHVHPHQFRHTFAHLWKLNGGRESDLMRIMGWRSADMVRRYGASAADEVARAAHHSARIADRF